MRGIIYFFLLIFVIFSSSIAAAGEQNITIPEPEIITPLPDGIGGGSGFNFDLIEIVSGFLSSTLFIIITVILLFIYLFQTIHPEGSKIGFFLGVIALTFMENISAGTVLIFAIIIMMIFLTLQNLQERKTQ